MKKYLIILATTLFACSSGEQTSTEGTEETTATEQTATEVAPEAAPVTEGTASADMGGMEHKCSDMCKEGNHTYAHGEKGHTCGDACMNMGEHKCADMCKDGNHTYAHGEKGHTCSDACKTTM